MLCAIQHAYKWSEKSIKNDVIKIVDLTKLLKVVKTKNDWKELQKHNILPNVWGNKIGDETMKIGIVIYMGQKTKQKNLFKHYVGFWANTAEKDHSVIIVFSLCEIICEVLLNGEESQREY